MRDLGLERIALAIAEAGNLIQGIPPGDPLGFKKREEIIHETVENFLGIGSSEPLFEVLKDYLDRAISLCPD